MDELILGLIGIVVIFPYFILFGQVKIKAKLQRQLLRKRVGIAHILSEGRQLRSVIFKLDEPSFSTSNKNFNVQAANDRDREAEFWYYEDGIPCLDYDVRDTRPIPHNQQCKINELISPETLQSAKINETNIFRSILMAAWSFLTQNKYVVPAIMCIIMFAGAAAYMSYTANEKLDALIPVCQAASTAAQTAATQAAQQLVVK